MLSGLLLQNNIIFHRIRQLLVQKIMEPYTPKLEGPIYYVLESLIPLQPPKKPTFTRKLKICRNLEIFKKVGFWGVQRGGFGFEPSKMILYMIIYYFWRVGGRKMPFFKKFYIWKMSFLKFSGALGGPPVKNFCQKWFQRFSHIYD